MHKYKPYLLLSLLLIIVVFINHSWKVFDYPPRSVHQWRQSDCAAYVKTYYRTGANIFKPATYNLAGKEGRVVSEFPVVYYTAARLQHIVGEHYWVVRGLTFICYLIGLFALLACVKRWVSNTFFALFPVVILATSPYFYYYAINFLPNVPAISFSFVGLYYFLRYEENGKRWKLILGTFFFILATALKPTDGGIIWLAYMAVWGCNKLSKKDQPYNKRALWPMLLSALSITACVLIWTKYANWYNDENGNHQNLLGIYPIWDMDKGLRNYTVKRIITEWSNVFQQKLVIGALGIFFLIYLLKWKQLNRFLKLFTLFSLLGVGAYAILWFKAFTDHDYYQLPYVLFGVFLAITITEYFVRKTMTNFKIIGLGHALCALLMAISIYHNHSIQRDRYTKPEYTYLNPAIYEVEPYLRKIGVKTTDAVVCAPDKSPNITLNAINNYGYSEEFNGEGYNIYTFKKQGAAYLIVSDSSYLHNPLYLPFMNKKIGEYKGIYVFDIR